MAARKRNTAQTVRNAGSWLAILAATTLGGETSADTVRALVRVDAMPTTTSDDQSFRLIVQSYDAEGGKLPSERAKPVGSVQRAVTAAELRDGVKVNLLELRQIATGLRSPLVVAWIEGGKPDLEYDGRMARPQPGSVYGTARSNGVTSDVSITLNKKA
ncbi:MAG: hypothetical protein ABIP39_11005 [Polyangiaceae bacterium]